MKPKYYWVKYTPEDEDPIITIGAFFERNIYSASYWQIVGVDGLIPATDPSVSTWYDEIKQPAWLDEEEGKWMIKPEGNLHILPTARDLIILAKILGLYLTPKERRIADERIKEEIAKGENAGISEDLWADHSTGSFVGVRGLPSLIRYLPATAQAPDYSQDNLHQESAR